MKHIIYISSILLFFACTKEINIDIPNSGNKFVVNGIIENGEVPKILLHRTLPYFESIYLNDNSIILSLVNDATLTITNSYGEAENLELVDNLGYPGFTDTWFYNYQGSGNMKGEEGVSYRLDIIKGDTIIWSVTSIPKLASVTKDSLKFLYRPDDSTYCYLLGHLIEPDTIGNCYRLFSKTKPIWGSTLDNSPIDGYDDLYISMLDQDGNYNDEYTNGWEFQMPMYKGRGFWQEWGEQGTIDSENNEQVDGSSGATTGFWNVGDSVILKWSSVDRGSWDFWASLQYNNPGGPFGSPSQANSNINGGLGVFGGSSSMKVHLLADPEAEQIFN